MNKRNKCTKSSQWQMSDSIARNTIRNSFEIVNRSEFRWKRDYRLSSGFICLFTFIDLFLRCSRGAPFVHALAPREPCDKNCSSFHTYISDNHAGCRFISIIWHGGLGDFQQRICQNKLSLLHTSMFTKNCFCSQSSMRNRKYVLHGEHELRCVRLVPSLYWHANSTYPLKSTVNNEFRVNFSIRFPFRVSKAKRMQWIWKDSDSTAKTFPPNICLRIETSHERPYVEQLNKSHINNNFRS